MAWGNFAKRILKLVDAAQPCQSSDNPADLFDRQFSRILPKVVPVRPLGLGIRFKDFVHCQPDLVTRPLVDTLVDQAIRSSPRFLGFPKQCVECRQLKALAHQFFNTDVYDVNEILFDHGRLAHRNTKAVRGLLSCRLDLHHLPDAICVTPFISGSIISLQSLGAVFTPNHTGDILCDVFRDGNRRDEITQALKTFKKKKKPELLVFVSNEAPGTGKFFRGWRIEISQIIGSRVLAKAGICSLLDEWQGYFSNSIFIQAWGIHL